MAQVVPGPDSAWVAEEWVAAAEPALAVVGAAGVAAPEGVVRVAAGCGDPVAGLGVEVLVPGGLAAGVELAVEGDAGGEELGRATGGARAQHGESAKTRS